MLYFARRLLTALHGTRQHDGQRLDKIWRTVQSKGVDVLAVITTSHVLLAKANGVLSGRNIVKDLEFSLRDALRPGK
jgi:hypothetical protein